MQKHILSRRAFLAGLSGLAVAAVGCKGDGNFTVLGYTTKPNYDTCIKTVYVPIFRNSAFQTTPEREMEMDLTRAVITQIESLTPYKVVSDPERADTELQGTLIRIQKAVALRNQQNEVRAFDLTIVCEIVWRDLRTGKILTNPKVRELDPSNREFDPSRVKPEMGPETAIPVQVAATGRALPEVGESNASAGAMAVKRMAIKIAQLMEKPWDLDAKECPK